MSLVILEKNGAVATITLNRPEAMNALSRGLRQELFDACQDIKADDSLRAAIITGAGTRAFTAGLDLKELGQDGLGAASDKKPSSNPVSAMESLDIPVIAAINGVAITGGFELALASDIRIASTQARFADTHARVGVMPGWGLSQKLSRTIGLSRACQLSFTGQFIDAEKACQWGLVNEVYEPDALMPAARALAEEIVGIDPDFIKRYKALIHDGYGKDFDGGMALEFQINSTYNASVSGESVEEKRRAVMERGRNIKG